MAGSTHGDHRRKEETRLEKPRAFASRVLAVVTSKLLADLISKSWDWMNS
ncbi:hypothetical protein CCYS_00220 [Corynebacterium cystitidis DSM 20524]|nr:hypothetical protein [Corynebacterium cystitidis]WJY81029.1 hypothetical protein CCYS_00220 [Corynebacterium cystitidis DSM 20524]SNV90571.1 Uncharacterised protein [Corynebacterium cystitidis]